MSDKVHFHNTYIRDAMRDASMTSHSCKSSTSSQGDQSVKHPSYCCQNCGDFIGWMGRFMFPFFHKCRNKTTKHMTEYTTQTTSIKFDKNPINPLVLLHYDGRVTISDGIKPDEAAKQMFNIFKDLWANDAQSVKIRDLEYRILKLKTAGNEMYKFINPPSPCMRSSRMDDLLQGWDDAKDQH